MKPALFGLLLLIAFAARGTPPGSLSVAPQVGGKAADLPVIPGWGLTSDLDADCQFRLALGSLKITVPGSDHPHDLSAEMNTMNAPRVTQKVHGDFTLQVRIDGTFEPGEESTQAGRTGYTGAGLVAFGDQKNYVRIERAALQARGIDRTGYVNFEIRVNGELQNIGTTGDRPIKKEDPLFLRLERKGNKMIGSVSEDGVTWEDMGFKDLPGDWPDDVDAGVAAISTSRQTFQPTYGGFHLKHAAAESATTTDAPAPLEKASDGTAEKAGTEGPK